MSASKDQPEDLVRYKQLIEAGYSREEAKRIAETSIREKKTKLPPSDEMVEDMKAKQGKPKKPR